MQFASPEGDTKLDSNGRTLSHCHPSGIMLLFAWNPQRKLAQSSELQRMYWEQLEEYLTLGFSEPVDAATPSTRTWHLPHHQVINVN